MRYRGVFAASIALALVIVGLALVGRAQAADTEDATLCDQVQATTCIALYPLVRIDEDIGSRVQISHAYTEPNRLVWINFGFYDLSHTLVVTGYMGVYSGMVRTFYIFEYPTTDIPVGFEGSMVLSSTEEFTATLATSNVTCDPGVDGPNCIVLNGLVARPAGGLSVSTAGEPLTRYYAVSNPLPEPLTVENRIYWYDFFLIGFGDTLAAGETKVYDLVVELERRRPLPLVASVARRVALSAGFTTGGSTIVGAAKIRSGQSFVAGRGQVSGWDGAAVFLPVVRR